MSKHPDLTLTDDQFRSLMDDVQMELDGMAKSEAQKLAKARPGEETTGEGESDSSKSDPAGESATEASVSPDPASSAPEASGSAPADDGSGAPPPPADASAGGPPPAADGSAPAGDPAAPGPLDHQTLVAEYSQLPMEAMKAHLLALKEALMGVLGGPADASAAPPMDPASAGGPPPAPGPSASAPPPPSMAMGEKGMDGVKPGTSATSAPDGMKDDPKANGENPLHKAEMDSLRASVDESNKVSMALLAIVKKVVEKPLRKSVAFAADMPAEKPSIDVSKLSREQVRAKLGTLIGDASLKKSDRELIVQYELKQVDLGAVAHLIK